MNKDSFLRPIAQRSVEFLSAEMGIELLKNSFEVACKDKMELFTYTAMIGIGGSVNLMFIMSFENDVLEALTNSFVYGGVINEELEPLKESVACEVANTMLGNAIPNFPSAGVGITITPPVMVEYGKTISKNGASKIAATTISTKNGLIAMAIVSQGIVEEELC